MSVIAFPYPAPAQPNRLRRIGRFVAVSSIVCAVVAVIGVPILWSSEDLVRQWVLTQTPLGSRPFTLNLDTRISGAAISLLGLAPVIFCLLQLAALFSRFARGEVFVDANAARIRRIGIALIANTLLSPLVQMLTTINLTRANVPGQIVVQFGFELSHVLSVLSGLALIAFASIMTEAVRLWHDNSEII
jgi:hypothetical protein